MRKGITGQYVVIVISLIVAVIGLVLFWFFLSNASETVKKFGEDMGTRLCIALKGIIRIPFLLGC